MIAATSDVSKYIEDIDETTSFGDLKDSLDKLKDGGKSLAKIQKLGYFMGSGPSLTSFRHSKKAIKDETSGG